MDDGTKRKAYKYCIVPECKSTSVKTPDKIFISNPRDTKRSMEWQMAMQRKVMLSVKSRFFVCEDHFNLETDMDNYVKFKLMHNVPIRMKPTILPHIFDCQQSSKTTYTSSLQESRRPFLKKQRQTTFEDSIEKLQSASVSKSSRGEDDDHLVQQGIQLERSCRCAQEVVTQRNKRIQASIRPRMLSRSTQCDL